MTGSENSLAVAGRRRVEGYFPGSSGVEGVGGTILCFCPLLLFKRAEQYIRKIIKERPQFPTPVSTVSGLQRARDRHLSSLEDAVVPCGGPTLERGGLVLHLADLVIESLRVGLNSFRRRNFERG